MFLCPWRYLCLSGWASAYLCAQQDLRPYRGLVGLWLWSSITHLSLWLGLCRVKEHCLFLVRGNS